MFYHNIEFGMRARISLNSIHSVNSAKFIIYVEIIGLREENPSFLA